MRSSGIHRAALAAAAVILLLGLTAVLASAAEPAGAAFVEEKGLQAKGTKDADVLLRFSIYNGSDAPRDLALYLADLSDEKGGQALLTATVAAQDPAVVSSSPPTPAGPGAVAADGTVHFLAEFNRVEAGAVRLVVLILPKPSPGPYEGTLLLTSSNGTWDRLGFEIAVDVDEPAPPGDDALRSPLPGTIPLKGYVYPDSDDPAVKIDPAYLAKLEVTPLLGDNGQTVKVTKADDTGTVSIASLPGAGTYSGQLVDAEGAAVSKLELTVKHSWPLPLAAAALGIVLGFAGQAWLTRIRPAWAFRLRLDDIARRARADIAAERVLMVDDRWIVPGAEPPELIWTAGRKPRGLLAVELERTRDAFDRTTSAEDREKLFGDAGTKIEPLWQRVSDAATLFDIGRLANAGYLSVMDRLEPAHKEAFGRYGFGTAARAALKGEKIDYVAELTGLTAGRTALDGALKQAETMLKDLDALERSGTPKAKTDEVREALVTMPDLAEASWKPVQARLQALRPKGAAGSRPAAGAAPRRLRAAGAAVPAATGRWSMVKIFLEQLVTAPLATLRHRIAAGDALYLALVVVVATVTGMNTNYAADATFGSPGDYATMITWAFGATVVAELVKYGWGALTTLVAASR